MPETTPKAVFINLFREPLLRYAFLISLLTAVFFSFYSLFYIFPQFDLQLSRYAKDASVRVTNHLKTLVPNEEPVFNADSFSKEIKDKILRLMTDLEIEKIKIFAHDGTIVFSSSPEDIGRENTHPYFFNTVAKGAVYSKLVHKNSRTLEERIVKTEVVETYVPIMSGKTFTAAIEVYYDITENSAVLSGLLDRLRLTILVFSISFVVIIFLILFRSSKNSLIKHQAEQSLQQAHNELEKLVKDRTIELEKSNVSLIREMEEKNRAQMRLQRSHDTRTIVNQLLRDSLDVDMNLDKLLDDSLSLLLSLPWLSFEAMGCIFLADEKSGTLVMKSQKGFPADLLKSCAVIPFGKCLCGRAAASQKTVFADHVDDRHDILPQSFPDHGHYCIPIQAKGLVLGIINIYVKAGHERTEREEDFLKAVANTLAGILMQRRGEKQKKEIEKQLYQSQKMEAIGTLAGGIAHDFNNILSGIFGYAQLALFHLDYPEKIRSDIDQIVLGAKRATDLIGQILTFSRQAEHEKRTVRFDLIIREALKFLRSSIPSDIRIDEDIISKSKVTANPTQLHQIVINLCTNAYHAMLETGGGMTVRLHDLQIDTHDDTPHHALSKGPCVKLEVIDTGHGMSRETLAKVFEPYFTTKKVTEGTGLGLAVVMGIVHDHGGLVTADSRPGKGSTFRVFLPVAKAEAIQEDIPDVPIKICKGDEAILLVDDELSILDATSELLSDCGYRVFPFSDPETALEEIKNQPDKFDLLITDVTMPNMTGDAFALKVLEIRKDMPIIMCTGYSHKISEHQALKMGVKKYLKKPIATNILLSVIREVLDKPLA